MFILLFNIICYLFKVDITNVCCLCIMLFDLDNSSYHTVIYQANTSAIYWCDHEAVAIPSWCDLVTDTITLLTPCALSV